MALAQITDKILNDAKAEAALVAEKARKEADTIAQKAENECNAIREDFALRFETERPEIFRRAEIVAGIDRAKQMLGAKRQLINDTFDCALKKLASMEQDEYLAFVSQLLARAVKTKEERIIIGEDEKYINAEWLSAYNAEHGTQLVMSEQRADIAGGLIISNGRISTDCSWDMLIKVMQEQREADVVKRLFE